MQVPEVENGALNQLQSEDQKRFLAVVFVCVAVLLLQIIPEIL